MRSFASDNNSGVHPLVMEALAEANRDHALGYGDDEWTRSAESAIKELFGVECDVYFVFNGTGSNTMALQLMTKPFGSIICAETAHIYVDECGAPARFTGCHIRPVATPDGKLTPELVTPYLHGFGDQHHSQPSAIYLSQCTELGTTYTPEELKALTSLAHSNGMFVHMDGARIANAAAYLGVSLAELTVGCGIDTLSFGGTKNGLMSGECVVVFNRDLAADARFYRKQATQLASKMRYLSAQFIAYLKDDLWLKNAEHANRMASLLRQRLSEFKAIEFTQPLEGNQLFFRMPKDSALELMKSYFFYFWNERESEVRMVTSFDTTEEDIDRLIETMRRVM